MGVDGRMGWWCMDRWDGWAGWEMGVGSGLAVKEGMEGVVGV